MARLASRCVRIMQHRDVALLDGSGGSNATAVISAGRLLTHASNRYFVSIRSHRALAPHTLADRSARSESVKTITSFRLLPSSDLPSTVTARLRSTRAKTG